MHEFAIIQSLVDLVREKTPQGMRVDEVVIEVGTLTGLVADSLTFYFEGLTHDTPLEGAKLICRVIRAKIRCQNCGGIYEPEDFARVCANCSALGGEILCGNELQLVHMEGRHDV